SPKPACGHRPPNGGCRAAAVLPTSLAGITIGPHDRQGEEMSARSAAGPDDPGPLILVADDDPDIRELVAGHLERRGYSVMAAGDGEAALRLVLERLPQVAVLDVGMPGLDGL